MNAQDEDCQDTALHLAVVFGNDDDIDFVKLLLTGSGVDPTLPDYDNQKPSERCERDDVKAALEAAEKAFTQGRKG